jgi:asparagine synthase (glutamine-hydrolysing)
MCGLANRFHPEMLPLDAAWARRADALLAHRGPDGSGHYVDDRCELVHRRLALIDLSAAGAQPMPNEDGSIQIVFNGEIYNHRELRVELQARGHRFRGSSDTEVLVHLYEEYGESLTARLRGMYAFALYDRSRSRLLLCRDRFGIKPLFWATHRGQYVFASEMKAILALEGFRPELDRQACYDFLALSYIPEPATGFANIAAVPRGTTLIVGASGVRTTSSADAPVPALAGRSRADLAAEVAELLSAAVARQAVADVPVAALLSGGIDSSLVVAAHARTAGGPLRTFNVSFPDQAHDETQMALATARRYGTQHQTVTLDPDDLSPDAVFGLLRHFDQPFADPSLVPTHAVARAVRRHGIICTLTGDGGDESFGGYSEFWKIERLYQLMGTPEWVLATAGGLARPLAGWTRDRGRQALKAVELARAGRSSPASLLAGLSTYVGEPEKERLVDPAARIGLEPVHRHFANPYAPAGDLEQLSRQMTRNHFELSLPSDMLRKVDMMSMRAGIEVRVPMLDEELVGLALTLSHREKTDGQRGKLILREIAAQWLPSEVANHPKHGFTVPLDVMVQPQFHEALADLIGASGGRISSFVQMPLVHDWLARFRNAGNGPAGGRISREGLHLRVLMLLALELWMRDWGLAW